MLKVVVYSVCKTLKMAVTITRASFAIIRILAWIVDIVVTILLCVLAVVLLYIALISVIQYVKENFIVVFLFQYLY